MSLLTLITRGKDLNDRIRFIKRGFGHIQLVQFRYLFWLKRLYQAARSVGKLVYVVKGIDLDW